MKNWTDEERDRFEKQYQRDSNVVAVVLFVIAAAVILTIFWMFQS